MQGVCCAEVFNGCFSFAKKHVSFGSVVEAACCGSCEATRQTTSLLQNAKSQLGYPDEESQES